MDISQQWSFVPEAADAQDALVRSSGAEALAVNLPHTWNAEDGQDGGNDYRRGASWYVKRIPAVALPQGGRAYLQFDGAAMVADVYVNDVSLAHHEGGYSSFRVDITDVLRAQGNDIAVRVDNAENDHVYPQTADFTFYGGLYRPVSLIVVPEGHIRLDYWGSNGLTVTPRVVASGITAGQQGRTAQTDITVETWVSESVKAVKFTICDGEGGEIRSASAPVAGGHASEVFHVDSARLWDGVKNPYLYTATVQTGDGSDAVSVRFGVRDYAMDPQRGFMLNGRPYPLRGVSRHQDRRGAGNALVASMQADDMKHILEIGANAVRLAHYQHSQDFYDLCDESGIVVWAEIPYITKHMPRGRANTLTQMRELIVQNHHHPSIVCWGLSNEITAASPINDELLANHRDLNALAHDLDPTRVTTMANVFMLEKDSPILDIPDVNGYNLYFGWYIGELADNDAFLDDFHRSYPGKALGLSEYGADANTALHSSTPHRGDYSEEYQCVYHEHMLHMIEQRPWLWSTFLWNMFDFAADGRDEGGAHGINQKGLVSFDRSINKDAFYVYKAYWSDQPFVHVCGRRYPDRTEAVTKVKVYANTPSVALYVDGDLTATMDAGDAEGDGHVFVFTVTNDSEHRVEARAPMCEPDGIVIRRVQRPNPSYVLTQAGTVSNWFDEDDDVDRTRYSIYDTLGELQSNPGTAAIVNRLMASAASSRGDVAEQVKDNPGLQRMMASTRLSSLLEQAGDVATADQVRQLNEALQQIGKE